MLSRSWIVFAGCALVRILGLLLSPSPDPTFYSELARPLPGHAGPGVLHQTMIEPAYPLLLAAGRVIGGSETAAVLLQIVVASLGGVWIFALTDRLSGSTRAAWTAAVLYALDPYLVRQSAAFMEVSVLTALLAGLAWSTVRASTAAGGVGTGVLAGLSVLTRMSALPIAMAAVAILLARNRRAGVPAAVCLALLAGGWMARMHALNGAILPTRAGTNLYLALSPEAEQIGPTVNPDVLNAHVYAKGAAATDPGSPMVVRQRAEDRYLRGEALRFAREHPWRALELKLRCLAHVFNPRLIPYGRLQPGAHATVTDGQVVLPEMRARRWIEEAAHVTWRTAILALAILGVALRGCRREDALLWATILSIAAAGTLYFPTTRLTTPMMVAWMFFAGIGGARLVRSSSAAARTRR